MPRFWTKERFHKAVERCRSLAVIDEDEELPSPFPLLLSIQPSYGNKHPKLPGLGPLKKRPCLTKFETNMKSVSLRGWNDRALKEERLMEILLNKQDVLMPGLGPFATAPAEDSANSNGLDDPVYDIWKPRPGEPGYSSGFMFTGKVEPRIEPPDRAPDFDPTVRREVRAEVRACRRPWTPPLCFPIRRRVEVRVPLPPTIDISRWVETEHLEIGSDSIVGTEPLEIEIDPIVGTEPLETDIDPILGTEPLEIDIDPIFRREPLETDIDPILGTAPLEIDNDPSVGIEYLQIWIDPMIDTEPLDIDIDLMSQTESLQIDLVVHARPPQDDPTEGSFSIRWEYATPNELHNLFQTEFEARYRTRTQFDPMTHTGSGPLPIDLHIRSAVESSWAAHMETEAPNHTELGSSSIDQGNNSIGGFWDPPIEPMARPWSVPPPNYQGVRIQSAFESSRQIDPAILFQSGFEPRPPARTQPIHSPDGQIGPEDEQHFQSLWINAPEEARRPEAQVLLDPPIIMQPNRDRPEGWDMSLSRCPIQYTADGQMVQLDLGWGPAFKSARRLRSRGHARGGLRQQTPRQQFKPPTV